MFLISINDVPNSKLHGCHYMLADNAALFYDSLDLPVKVDRAIDDLVEVIHHLNNIGLTLNLSKTKYLHFHNSRRRVPFKSLIIINGSNRR